MTLRKLIAATLALSVLAFALPLLMPPSDAVREAAGVGLPWQIDVLDGGHSRVFGVTLGRTRFAEAHLGEAELAVVAAPGEAGQLEAYVERAQAGFVSGRMVLTLDAPAAALADWRARAVKVEPMQSTTRRYTLAAADRAAAATAVISAIAFIPSIQLDAETVRARFGEPAERIERDTISHWLYPARGLDVAIDAGGRDVLQYVAPAVFARLRAPLD